MSGRALTVLLTGFEPFDGEPVNPSARLVQRLARGPAPQGTRLVAAVLPVDRHQLAPALEEQLARHRPDVVVAVGQATGRARIALETRAANAIDYRGRQDNGGHEACGEPLHPGGPPQLQVSGCWPGLADELAGAGHPVRCSDDAGRHLCNALLYELLWRHRQLPAAFVHVPLLPEQAARRTRGEPSLDEDVSLAFLTHLLALLPRRLPRAPDSRGPPAAGA